MPIYLWCEFTWAERSYAAHFVVQLCCPVRWPNMLFFFKGSACKDYAHLHSFCFCAPTIWPLVKSATSTHRHTRPPVFYIFRDFGDSEAVFRYFWRVLVDFVMCIFLPSLYLRSRSFPNDFGPFWTFKRSFRRISLVQKVPCGAFGQQYRGRNSWKGFVRLSEFEI